MYRYWTGTDWSPVVTANPAATPPPNGAPAPSAPRRRSGPGWLIAILVGVIALAAIVWLVFQGIGRVTGSNPLEPNAPASQSQDVCPSVDPTATTQAPTQQSADRVYGGKLSYPKLGSPWGEVEGDNRVPFGRDVAVQTVMVEPNYDGLSSWVASVLVAELVAGDGFFSPQDGADIVMRCVTGTFYGDAEVTRNDTVSEAITVDGHDAWVIESQLSFDIPDLTTTSELAIIVVVDTGVEASSLYYASIPDTVADLATDARAAMEDLRVES